MPEFARAMAPPAERGAARRYFAVYLPPPRAVCAAAVIADMSL